VRPVSTICQFVERTKMKNKIISKALPKTPFSKKREKALINTEFELSAWRRV
jgi:hypothetical protein